MSVEDTSPKRVITLKKREYKMKPLLLTVGMCVTLASQAFAETNKPTEGKINVWVFTNTASADGFTDAGQKFRVDSVKEVKKHLNSKWLALSPDEKSADITVEVIDKMYHVGNIGFYDLYGSGFRYIKDYVYIVVKIGNHIVAFYGQSTGSGAAKNAVANLEPWVKENYEQIIKHRKVMAGQ
jgi:hypothetical protein